ncbi:MAG TPA: nitroreductase family protein [Candidatus Cloacimonas sp.]|nr:nitroreductase family protein [Candidatus Cloacimonas sp.]HPS60276.1 nitroreductase family protein [Candidatus Cloacimonas sp.]
MDAQELIFDRHSVRDFLPEPIAMEILSDILQAGRLAPSTQNRQPWRYIVFTENAKIRKLAVNCGLIGLSNFFIRQAPCLIIACADLKDNININGQDYYLVDTAISFHQLLLYARSYGIESCWLAAFSEKKLRNYLQLPTQWKIVAMAPLGYPKEKKGFYSKTISGLAKSSQRKPLEEIVRFM